MRSQKIVKLRRKALRKCGERVHIRQFLNAFYFSLGGRFIRLIQASMYQVRKVSARRSVHAAELLSGARQKITRQ